MGFGIWNTAQGIRNPIYDWNPESKFHSQSPESSTCNPESTAWNPESKTVLDSLKWDKKLTTWVFLSLCWIGYVIDKNLNNVTSVSTKTANWWLELLVSERILLLFQFFSNYRPHSYTYILLTSSYRVTERETVQGVAKAAVRDFARLFQEGVYKEGQILLLMADGTHKNKSNTSMTGPWFLDYEHEEEIAVLLKVWQKPRTEGHSYLIAVGECHLRWWHVRCFTFPPHPART